MAAFPGLTAANVVATSAARATGLQRVYRPAALVKLRVLLDNFQNEDGELAQDQAKPATPPRVSSKSRLGTQKAAQATRRAAGRPDIGADAQIIKSQRAPAPAGTAPEDVKPDDLSFEIVTVPTDVSVELNGFRTADKAQLTFPLVDLPLDPDIIRSILVDVFMGTVPATDFATPDRWHLSTTDPTRKHLMFRGYVDVEQMEVGNDFTVQLQAVSMESRLMTEKINPLTKARRIEPGGEKITHYVQKILSTVPEFSGELGGNAIRVIMFPNATNEPVLDRKSLNRTLQSAASRAAANGGNVAGPTGDPGTDPALAPGQGQPMMPLPPGSGPGETTVWDLLTKACELVGLIPVYDPSLTVANPDTGAPDSSANYILLIPPQNIMETPQGGTTIPGGAIDGFSRTFTVDGKPVRSDVRLMVWGHNLSKMKVSRKFGRITAPAVQLRCYNPDGVPEMGKSNSRVLVATYPEKKIGTRAPAVGTGGKAGASGHRATREIITKTVKGIRNLEDLKRAACALWHSISRQEMTLAIESDDLASYIDPTDKTLNHNDEADLLRLRPGSPVRVTVARAQEDPSKGLIVDQLSELFERRANPQFLRKLLEGGGGRLPLNADAKSKIDAALMKLETSYQKARLKDWFYTRAAHHKWNIDSGYSFNAELVNYSEARMGVAQLSADDQKIDASMKKLKPGKKKDGRAAAVTASKDKLIRGMR